MNLSAGRGWIAAAALASLAVTLFYGVNGDTLWSFAGRCDNRDTGTFYYAAQAALAGLDPYDNPALKQAFGVFTWWVYPPSGLLFFLPLTGLSFAKAIVAFNIVKAIAIVGLVVVWCKTLPSLRRDVAFWLFALVALNTTVLQDWCSGNIAIFESLALWGALLLSLRGRYGYAVLLVLLISLAKPTWLVLLLLPVLVAPYAVGARRAAMVGAAVGAVLIALWLLLDYASFQGWLFNVRSTLSIRYNFFELTKDIRVGLGGGLNVPLWQRPEYALYAIWCVLVAVLLLRRWRSLTGQHGPMRGLLLVLAIAAVSPANLSYSWVMTVPIVYRVMLDAAWPLRLVLAVLALLPPPLLALLLPFRDVGMLPLVVVMLGFAAFALQTPQRKTNLKTID